MGIINIRNASETMIIINFDCFSETVQEMSSLKTTKLKDHGETTIQNQMKHFFKEVTINVIYHS